MTQRCRRRASRVSAGLLNEYCGSVSEIAACAAALAEVYGGRDVADRSWSRRTAAAVSRVPRSAAVGHDRHVDRSRDALPVRVRFVRFFNPVSCRRPARDRHMLAPFSDAIIVSVLSHSSKPPTVFQRKQGIRESTTPLPMRTDTTCPRRSFSPLHDLGSGHLTAIAAAMYPPKTEKKKHFFFPTFFLRLSPLTSSFGSAAILSGNRQGNWALCPRDRFG